MIIRNCRDRDLSTVARIFARSFPESFTHIFGYKPPHTGLVEDIFAICLQAEPGAFFVAEDQGKVIGYIFAPSRTNRIWQTAVQGRYLGKWLKLWLTGKLGLGWSPIRILLLNKLFFLLSALNPRYAVAARILSIAVSPEERGKGVAGELLTRGLRYLQETGAHAIRLEVRPHNVPALQLYRRAGFYEVGTTRDSQGTWLVMIKNFSTGKERSHA